MSAFSDERPGTLLSKHAVIHRNHHSPPPTQQAYTKNMGFNGNSADGERSLYKIIPGSHHQQFLLHHYFIICIVLSIYLVQFSHSVMSDSLQPHGMQHAMLPCPSPAPGACSKSCPLSWWCHPTIWYSVVPFSSCLQSYPPSGLFQWVSSSHQVAKSIGVSALASVLPMNTQDWSPLGWTGLIFLQSEGLSRVFSNTTVQKHQFFCAQLFLQSNSHGKIACKI